MAANLFPVFNSQFFDTGSVLINGVTVTGVAIPASGYSLYQYASGTTTNQATYTDIAGTISNANPIVLDTAGRCTMFGGVLAYTFVLKTPGGATVKTWDNVSAIPVVSGTAFLPLAGGSMTGPIVLAADATAALNPVSLQQMNIAVTAGSASVAASVAAATAAAAAATAAAAAVAPTSFSLSSGTGGAVTRTVTLAAGTWQVTLDTRASYAPGAEANHDFTVTQAATVGATTVNTSSHFYRAGGSGYGRITHACNLAASNLVVAATGSFTMSIAAVSLGAAGSDGSRLTVEKTA